MATLPNLRRLAIKYVEYSSASMAALSRLTALSYLELDNPASLPPPMALPALQRLCVSDEASVVAEEALDGMLQPLTQLVGLALGAVDVVPPAVGSLAQLQQLCIWRTELPAVALPAPHSLHRLRRLGLEWRVAAASVPALMAMPALQELWLRNAPDKSSARAEQWAAFWAWAAAHPPLRRLRLRPFLFIEHRHTPLTVCSHMTLEILMLVRSRPSLHVHLDHGSHTTFYDAFNAE
mgnify:CR=1 FL=1